MHYSLWKEDLDYILNETKHFWKKEIKFFITGGTGFFGIWLLESLLWINERLGLNSKITILTRNLDSFRKKVPHLVEFSNVSFVIGDIRRFDFPNEDYDFLIHAASASAESKFLKEDPEERFSVIFDGTRNVLDFAKSKKIKNILFISSGAIYGKRHLNIIKIDEMYNGSPDIDDDDAEYGIGKKSAEFICYIRAKKYNMDIKIARCFTFIGPYLPLDLHYSAGNFIRDALKGGPIVVKSDGRAVRSYMYMSDLMVWLFTILFKGKSCYPYNVGSEEEITIKELAYKVAEVYYRLTGKKVDVVIEQKPDPSKPVDRYVPSTRRAREELGLTQKVSLDEAIERTLKFYLNR